MEKAARTANMRMVGWALPGLDTREHRTRS